MPKVEIDKHDLISLLCYRRDSKLAYYVQTCLPGWKEHDVIDPVKYREYILETVTKDEALRANLVGQEPKPTQEMVEQWERAFKDPKWGRVYNKGFPVPTV